MAARVIGRAQKKKRVKFCGRFRWSGAEYGRHKFRRPPNWQCGGVRKAFFGNHFYAAGGVVKGIFSIFRFLVKNRDIDLMPPDGKKHV